MRDDNPPLCYKGIWITIGVGLISAVVYLSLTSKPMDINLPIPFLDKFEHAFAYFVQMFWFSMVFFRKKLRLLIFGALIAMGVFLEVLQGIGHYRYFEYADMAANTTGVVIGYALGLTSLRFGLLWFENRISKGLGSPIE